MKPPAEAKNIDIRVDVDASIPEVLSDREHLQQVFHNLVGNAIKFSPFGSDIRIGARLDDGGRSIRFSISDQGPGIPEDEQALIFKKYYRGRGTRENRDGVGLGLSISREIVQAQGGNIWVESKRGEGSTFVFTLPVASDA
jgi:signal transduction histidine kinase